MDKQHGEYENIGCLEKDRIKDLDKIDGLSLECNVALFHGRTRRKFHFLLLALIWKTKTVLKMYFWWKISRV